MSHVTISLEMKQHLRSSTKHKAMCAYFLKEMHIHCSCVAWFLFIWREEHRKVWFWEKGVAVPQQVDIGQPFYKQLCTPQRQKLGILILFLVTSSSFYSRQPKTGCLPIKAMSTFDFIFLQCKKKICLKGFSDWSLQHRPPHYFETACSEFITGNNALFITTVFTSMNIHEDTTRQEWGWNSKTN